MCVDDSVWARYSESFRMPLRTTFGRDLRDDKISSMLTSSGFGCICDVLFLHVFLNQATGRFLVRSQAQRRLSATITSLRPTRPCVDRLSSSRCSLDHQVTSWTTTKHDNTEHAMKTRRRRSLRLWRQSHPDVGRSKFIFVFACWPVTLTVRLIDTARRRRVITCRPSSGETHADHTACSRWNLHCKYDRNVFFVSAASASGSVRWLNTKRFGNA